MREPFISAQQERLLEFDAGLDLPVTQDACVIFPLDGAMRKFNIESGMTSAQEILRGQIPMETFREDLELLNHPSHLTPPLLVYRLFITLLVGLVLMVVIIFFTIIWFMTILDLVLLAVIVWILRKLFIILWVWRDTKLAQANFPGLRRYIGRLNSRYEEKGLRWTLDENGHWLQLGQKAVEHRVFR